MVLHTVQVTIFFATNLKGKNKFNGTLPNFTAPALAPVEDEFSNCTNFPLIEGLLTWADTFIEFANNVFGRAEDLLMNFEILSTDTKPLDKLETLSFCKFKIFNNTMIDWNTV